MTQVSLRGSAHFGFWSGRGQECRLERRIAHHPSQRPRRHIVVVLASPSLSETTAISISYRTLGECCHCSRFDTTAQCVARRHLCILVGGGGGSPIHEGAFTAVNARSRHASRMTDNEQLAILIAVNVVAAT
jgi:hypothetical protein